MNEIEELQTKIFVASNGPSRLTGLAAGQVEKIGKLVYPVPKRIDPFNNFEKLAIQVERFLDLNADTEDLILIADSSIVLTLLTSYFLYHRLPLKVIDYDALERDHKIYTYNQGTHIWQTQATD